jgi:hypothetical protein
MTRVFRNFTSSVMLCLTIFSVTPVAIATLSWAADKDRSSGSIQTGYAIVTPTPTQTLPNTMGLVVFETFGELRPAGAAQAGVLPSPMTTKAMLFVSSSGRLSRNLGVAIANPSGGSISITIELRDAMGGVVATKSVQLLKQQQTARFVTELFADQPSVSKDFEGTLTLSSTTPFAVVGLRFRGENFSTIPATNVAPSTSTDVPLIGGVGGPGSVILAHFAVGGGWSSEIVLANASDKDLVVRVDLFKQDGTPLVTDLNNQSASTFGNITVKAGGLVVLAPLDKHGDSDF